MKDGICFGMLFGAMIGMVAGAYLYKNNQTAKEMLDKGEKAIKKEVKNLTTKK